LNGHGHVVPRADGALARCGGPAICRICAEELRGLQASARRAPPQVRDQLRLCCHEALDTPRDLEQAAFRFRQHIAAMLQAIAEIDRLQERVQELEAGAADALHRARQNPET
jgi:hypothetical protein